MPERMLSNSEASTEEAERNKLSIDARFIATQDVRSSVNPEPECHRRLASRVNVAPRDHQPRHEVSIMPEEAA